MVAATGSAPSWFIIPSVSIRIRLDLVDELLAIEDYPRERITKVSHGCAVQGEIPGFEYQRVHTLARAAAVTVGLWRSATLRPATIHLGGNRVFTPEFGPLNWQTTFRRVRARSSRPVPLDGSYRSSRQVATMLSGEMVPNELIEKMRRDWDRRAVENHRYYIVNSRTDWSDEEFWKSGETSVSQYVLTDMGNVCQGRRPTDMRVLDFGCGAGRVTRALAKVFGEVHGVDISGEMVGLARHTSKSLPLLCTWQRNF